MKGLEIDMILMIILIVIAVLLALLYLAGVFSFDPMKLLPV
jgi:hypothetical protein